MSSLCLYFQLHQPDRLRPFSVFDLEQNPGDYFDHSLAGNAEIFQKVAAKSYRPMLTLLLELTELFPDFKFSLSMSGVWLDQAKKFAPDVVEIIRQLVASGQVELLAETFYHSLAGLYSPTEFERQVKLHTQAMLTEFSVKPQVFRNTELMYWNELAPQVAKLGYVGMLTEAVPRYLGQRPKTCLYRSFFTPSLPLLLKHAELSDDVAFRFSDKNWPMFPLDANKYLTWLADYRAEEVINLFMDFETFGEHQWSDTGIFAFFSAVVQGVVADPWSQFVTPSQLIATVEPVASLSVYDVPEPISWADIDRDLTAWRGNELQWDTLEQIYQLESAVLKSEDPVILDVWGRLQTSDHFYYMCTKWSADGDVHAYFSPYDSPFEAYNRYCAVLVDFKSKLKLI